MSTPCEEREPLVFGEAALGFVREELGVAGKEFGGPLAARLLVLELRAPFSFLRPEVRQAAQEWHHGGIDDGCSDSCLAIAISGWLRQPDEGRRRLAILEESLGKYSDPSIDTRG
jgi:hypothetical protein